MQAFVYQQYGEPEGLKFQSVEKPAPGDQEVSVDLKGCFAPRGARRKTPKAVISWLSCNSRGQELYLVSSCIHYL